MKKLKEEEKKAKKKAAKNEAAAGLKARARNIVKSLERPAKKRKVPAAESSTEDDDDETQSEEEEDEDEDEELHHPVLVGSLASESSGEVQIVEEAPAKKKVLPDWTKPLPSLGRTKPLPSLGLNRDDEAELGLLGPVPE